MKIARLELEKLGKCDFDIWIRSNIVGVQGVSCHAGIVGKVMPSCFGGVGLGNVCLFVLSGRKMRKNTLF